MKTVLAVAGVIAVVFLLLLIIPLRAKLKIKDDKTFLTLQYLFFKRDILPEKEKETEQTANEAAAPKNKTAKAETKTPKKPSVKELVPIAINALPKCIAPIRKLLKRTTVADFELCMVVVGEDAADTAVKFGRMNALVFPAVKMASEIITLKYNRVELIPGFAAEKEQTDLYANVRITPLAALMAAANIAIIVLGAFMRAEKNKPTERKSQNGKEQPAHQ